MTDWLQAASDCHARGEDFVLITILGVQGSTPRDSGTKMLVTTEESYSTIGGGHLEYKAIAAARQMLQEKTETQKIEHFPLAAKLGQCCGGSATLLFETFAGCKLNIMVFGAGHVGKALTSILAQLPCRVHWVDSREDYFPEQLANNVTAVVNENPADEVASMPAGAYYIVMTHSHQMDFEICRSLLKRDDVRYAGLIGSESKWLRFTKRFEHRGYTSEHYQTLRCPVGLSSVPGKLPIEVAVSIAGEIIAEYHQDIGDSSNDSGISWNRIKTLSAQSAQILQLVASDSPA